MVQHLSDLRQKYLNKGYVVLKSFYNKDIIRQLRSQIIDISNQDKEILNYLIVQELILREDLISKIHKWVFDKNKLLEAASHCKEVIKEKYHVDVQVNVVKNCLRYVSND